MWENYIRYYLRMLNAISALRSGQDRAGLASIWLTSQFWQLEHLSNGDSVSDNPILYNNKSTLSVFAPAPAPPNMSYARCKTLTQKYRNDLALSINSHVSTVNHY